VPRTVDVSWLTGVVRVRREWEPEELIGSWTLLDEDWRLLANKTGPSRLGFIISSP